MRNGFIREVDGFWWVWRGDSHAINLIIVIIIVVTIDSVSVFEKQIQRSISFEIKVQSINFSFTIYN